MKKLQLGNWRAVTEAGKIGVRDSLQASSNDPSSTDPENLKTGISPLEYILVMPLSWFNLGKSFFCSSTHLHSQYQNRKRQIESV